MLLILDRRIDLTTSFLSQWTFQAMVHELIGIQNGRVDLKEAVDSKSANRELVLSFDQDSFYRENLFSNFGDLGGNIKSLVNEFQQKTKLNVQIESISDMKRFIEDYPEFKKMSGNVSKHVTLVGELSRLVDKYKLLEVSELEQNIACTNGHANDFKELLRFIQRPDIDNKYKIRLSLIYYEKYGKNLLKTKSSVRGSNYTDNMKMVLELLAKNAIDVTIFDKLYQYEEMDFKKEESIQSTPEVLGMLTRMNFKTAENVYTQHVPFLSQIIDSLLKGKLKDSSFPVCGNTNSPLKISEIIVFFVNGVTFEEAKWVSQFNSQNNGVKIVLGGTCIHNTESMLKEIEAVK